MTAQANFNKTFGKDVLQNSNVHVNFEQDFIVTTEDKIRLCMMEHANQLADQTSWISPVSLFVTIILVLLTASFNDALGLTKDTWQAIFVISAVLTAIWAVRWVIRAVNSSTSVDKIVTQLKQSQIETEHEPPKAA